MSKNWKNSAVEKTKKSTSCCKQRKGQKEITTFCSINCDILKDSVCYALKVWVSFKEQSLKCLLPVYLYACLSRHLFLQTPCFFFCCHLGQVFQFKFLVTREKAFLFIIFLFSFNISDFRLFCMEKQHSPPWQSLPHSF